VKGTAFPSLSTSLTRLWVLCDYQVGSERAVPRWVGSQLYSSFCCCFLLWFNEVKYSSLLKAVELHWGWV